MKYHYVILGSEWDVYKTVFSDLELNDDVLYVPGLSFLYGVKLARYINSIIIRINRVPLGKLFIRPLSKKLLSITKPICFVLFGNWVEYEFSVNFLENLKQLFPNARFVWFMQDIVESHPRIKSNIIETLKKFDLTLSYDFLDCKQYNLIYYPTGFSSIEINDSDVPHTDIYFLGKVKNRLAEIIKSFEFFKSKGLKTDFYLVGVPKCEQVYADEIHYIDGMSYLENLRHVKGCQCVLEIMQKGGSGYTLRTNEAVYFNKRIISNNQYLRYAPFYDEANICVVDESFTVNTNFIENIKTADAVNYNYRHNLSPLRLIEFIDSKLV